MPEASAHLAALLGKPDYDCPVYNGCDLIQLVASYKFKPEFFTNGVWTKTLKERLEMIAWIYRVGKAEEEKMPTPSATLAQLDKLRPRAKFLVTALDAADEYLKDELRLAAKELADIYGLPDFEQEAITYESIPPGDLITSKRWPVDRQIEKARRALNWLAAVIDTAHCRMTNDMRRPGNRADVHLHELVRVLDASYRNTADRPRNPSYDDKITGWERGEGGRGELLDLMRVVFAIVGIEKKSSVALLALWERATGNVGSRKP